MNTRSHPHRTGHAPPVPRRFVLGALATLATAPWASSRAKASEPLRVAVGVLPYKQVVERVGGPAVQVDILVRPGQDVHTYEPAPSQVAALMQARVFFRVGMPFEDRLVARLDKSSPRVPVVDLRQGIELRPMADRDHSHGHDHRHTGAQPDPTLDPHIWNSPRLVRRQAATVRDALIALRPTERERFDSGYTAYARELDTLDAELQRLFSGKTGRRFMVFHPSWGYLASDYGLEQVSIEVEGKEPPPKALARIIERARADDIRVVFVQPQFSRKAAEQVARAIGGEVVTIDPLAEDLLGNLRLVGEAIARNLR